MYSITLALHNLIRWIVLFIVAVAVVRAWIGWQGKKEWAPLDRRFGMLSAMGMDIQILLGLWLYIFLSPLTRTAFQDFGSAMGVKDIRFFALEHGVYMLLAVVFAHLGSMLPRKADSALAKHRSAAIWFTLTLLLLLAGTPWFRPLLPGLGG